LFSRTFTQGWAALGAPLLVIGMVYTGWFNLKTYFVDYARLAPNMAAITIATEFREYRDEYDLYLAGAPVLYAAHGTLRFVVGDGLVRDLDEIDELPDPYQNGRGVMVIAVIPRDADLREIINRYPSGIFSSGADRSGREMFVAYRIPASGSAQ
jgi:hypothetical protein